MCNASVVVEYDRRRPRIYNAPLHSHISKHRHDTAIAIEIEIKIAIKQANIHEFTNSRHSRHCHVIINHVITHVDDHDHDRVNVKVNVLWIILLIEVSRKHVFAGHSVAG